MKSVYFCILFQFLLVTSLWCQNILHKGIIEYTITEIESFELDQLTNYQNSMLLGSTFTVYFDQNYLRRDVNMMKGIMKYTYISNIEEKSNTLYMNMEGHKIKIILAHDIFNAIDPEDIRSMVLYNKDNTKKILNFSCYLAEIDTINNEFEHKFVMFITDDLIAPNFCIDKINTAGLSGIPLQLSKINTASRVTYTVTYLSPDIDSNVFDFDDTGYTTMTYIEFQNIFEKFKEFR